jgi:hypothetical protein
VDTIVRPPEVTAAPPAPRPRRGRRIVVVVALVLLASVIAYIWRYQPLSTNGTGAAWVDPRFGTSIGFFTPPTGEDFTAYRVKYVDGETFRYGLTLYNEGPLPVMITGVGDDACDDCVFPLEFERSLVAPSSGQFQYDPGHALPFTTVEMGSGDYRFFVVESRFDHCEANSEGVGYGYTLVPVTYRIGLISRSVLLPMPFTLEIGTNPAGCPNGLGTAG